MYSRKFVEENTILLTVTGSRMYGMATLFSDWDWRGIFVKPKNEYLGFYSFEQKDNGWDEEGLNITPFNKLSKDTVIYDLRKYLSLASKGNPNILELLYSKDYAYVTEVGQELIKHRESFLTPKVKYSYVGYAYSQIKRMENHRKWLLDPPKAPPVMEDYGFTDHYPILSTSEVMAFCEFLYDSVRNKVEYLAPTEMFHDLLFEQIDYKALFKTYAFEETHLDKISKITGTDENFILKVQNSKRYYKDLRKWENFLRWKKKRNPERARMEAMCGYDVKHATHCVRLLIQALNIVEKGVVITSISDFDKHHEQFIRELKLGETRYEALKEFADELFEKVYNTNFGVLNKPLSHIQLSNLFISLLELHEKGKAK